ncbi:ribonuclease toxin immunity protein CdiI [Chitinimonas viridis]|nr:ribonuclease toxin immunity protein CdiI [Chitinimonas viridis]
MSVELFKLQNVENDPEWIIKEFFNSAYFQGEFVSAVNSIAAGRSCVINEDYCLFADPEGPDPELYFDGVKFGIMNDQVVVTNEKCKTFLQGACSRYVELHPEDREKLPK